MKKNVIEKRNPAIIAIGSSNSSEWISYSVVGVQCTSSGMLQFNICQVIQTLP
jgi:hypothetical protein